MNLAEFQKIVNELQNNLPNSEELEWALYSNKSESSSAKKENSESDIDNEFLNSLLDIDELGLLIEYNDGSLVLFKIYTEDNKLKIKSLLTEKSECQNFEHLTEDSQNIMDLDYTTFIKILLTHIFNTRYETSTLLKFNKALELFFKKRYDYFYRYIDCYKDSISNLFNPA